MTSFQKYLTIVSILITSLKYCEGPDGRAKGNIFKYNNKHSVETLNKILPSEENTDLPDDTARLNLKVMNNFNSFKNSYLYYLSILWSRNMDDSPQKNKKKVVRRDVDTKTVNSSSDQIHIYGSRNKVSILDSNGNEYLDWNKNLTDSSSYGYTSGSFNDADLNGTFTDTDLNETFNDTDTNGTESTTPMYHLTSIAALLPVCELGDENCTKCQDISPFCHYMYSESRCVYYNYIHASKLYECGERWFTVDNNQPLFATALLILVISSSLLGYLIYLRSTVEFKDIAILATDDTEYEEMRRVIDGMREKYPNVAKNIQDSSNQ